MVEDVPAMIIEALLWENQKEREKHIREKKIYLTELTGCLRKAYYNIKDPLEITDTNAIINMVVGKMYHETIQQALVKYLGAKETEVLAEFALEKPVNGWVIRGRPDIYIPSWSMVIELKTVKSLYYIEHPQEHHTQQIAWYMDMLKAKHGRIVYIQKFSKRDGTSMDMKCFSVLSSAPKARIINTAAEKLSEHLNNDTVPSKCPIADWECKYCQYKDRCEG